MQALPWASPWAQGVLVSRIWEPIGTESGTEDAITEKGIEDF